jgi:hypothetical protein
MSPRWGSTPRLTDWLSVSRNVTLILIRDISVQFRSRWGFSWGITCGALTSGQRKRKNLIAKIRIRKRLVKTRQRSCKLWIRLMYVWQWIVTCVNQRERCDLYVSVIKIACVTKC